VTVSSSNGHALDVDRIDEHGAGCCPLCGDIVRGEVGTLVSYWHPVEVCRDRLASQLESARRRLALHGETFPR
jgi:hypothetical protein